MAFGSLVTLSALLALTSCQLPLPAGFEARALGGRFRAHVLAAPRPGLLTQPTWPRHARAGATRRRAPNRVSFHPCSCRVSWPRGPSWNFGVIPQGYCILRRRESVASRGAAHAHGFGQATERSDVRERTRVTARPSPGPSPPREAPPLRRPRSRPPPGGGDADGRPQSARQLRTAGLPPGSDGCATRRPQSASTP